MGGSAAPSVPAAAPVLTTALPATMTFELLVDSVGSIRCIYDETIDLATLGRLSIRRASYVEPSFEGRWIADLRPVEGPVLGPFSTRSTALTAEVDWLRRHWPCAPAAVVG
jgi:hypothetical protein